MPRRTQTGIDSESLQADVMRFMAIIAFCLIAILALVRNIDAPPITEPAAVQEPETPPAVIEPVALPTPEPEPAPVEPAPVEPPKIEVAVIAPEPIEPVVIEAPVVIEPALFEPALLEPIAPAPEPAVPETTEPVPEPLIALRPEPVVRTPAPEPEPEPDPAPPQQTQSEQGLSLRFVSDKDFLRLISKRDIQVFLFNDNDSYQLSQTYEFVSAQTPNQLYEVLPQTIPSAISGAASRSLGDYQGYRWGLLIPGRIEQQIHAHIAAVDSGELVIDRFGQVRHVPAG